MKRKCIPAITAGLVFAADRISKALAERIPPEGTVLVPGIVGLRRAWNTGAAFSLFSGHPWLLGVLSAAIIAGAVMILRKKHLSAFALTGLMMMLGGAVGNMIDRLTTGYVPDMIEFLFVRFAVFNVADIFLTIGCALVVLSLLRSEFPRGRTSGRKNDHGSTDNSDYQ